MQRDEHGDEYEEWEEGDPDDEGEEDEEGEEGDPDDEEYEDDEHDDEPEDRGGEVAAAAPPPPPRFSIVEPRPRLSGWLPLEDERVHMLDVSRRERGPGINTSRYVCRIHRPFPELQTFIRDTCGPGVYVVAQKDARHKYIGASTVKVMDGNGAAGATAAVTTDPPRTAPAPVPIVSDWRTQAIVTGGALLTSIIALVGAKNNAPKEARSALSELKEVLELMQVSSEERAKIFNEGMQLARTALEQTGGNGAGTDWAKVAESAAGAVSEIAKTIHAAREPAREARAALPAADSNAAFIEQAIIHEVTRAVRVGDPPDTLAMMLEAWLDDTALAWLQAADEDTVLAELPKRYPHVADLLKREPVVEFLRGTLRLLRGDGGSGGGDELRSPEAAGAAQG